MDRYIRHVPKTKENPVTQLENNIEETKEMLLKERGVKVRDALEVINKRDITYEDVKGFKRQPPTVWNEAYGWTQAKFGFAATLKDLRVVQKPHAWYLRRDCSVSKNYKHFSPDPNRPLKPCQFLR